ICAYCRAAVARSGADAALIGKVPDLVSTSTQLGLGDRGTLDGHRFHIAGRLQLDQGAAAWDEWYVVYGDGGDGWLAEARGALFATRRVGKAAPLPAFEQLAAGQRLTLPGLEEMAVDEAGLARFVCADGALLVQAEPDTSYRFDD